MVSGRSAEELPPGWKEHVKVSNGRKIKYYTHGERGLKFYSKKQVISSEKMQASEGTLQSVTRHTQKSNTSKSEVSPVVVEKNVSLEWLPLGWIVESRTRKNGSIAGSIYKAYVDPTTGCKFYSKPQVLKYLDRVNSNSTPEMQKPEQEITGDKCSKQDALQNFESIEDKSTISGKDDREMGKMPLGADLNVVDRSTELDDLPPGWVKETRARKSDRKRKDPEVSGDKCSKQDALQNFESIEDNRTISGKDDREMGKMPLGADLNVVDRSTELDDLPPGWVKETRARKSDRKRKDPYYINPVNGYEFRSKKDALRYLETGDIGSCVVKPKKSEVRFEDAICAPTKTDRLKLDLMAIDDHGAVSSSATAVLHSAKKPEVERFKETETHYISADSKSTTVDENEDKKFSEVTGCGGSEHSCETNIIGSKLSSVKVNDNEAVSTTGSAVLHEQKYPEDRLDTKAQIDLKNSKKRKPLSVPARSSKRLSGQEPEMLPMKVSSERALRAAVKKSVQKEANVSIVEQKAAANGSPHQLDTNQHRELIAELFDTCEVATLETEMPNNNIEKPSPVQDVPEQAVEQQVQERQEGENPRSQDSHVWYPFGDSLSDPCYEFAFKTLTGEIPFEDTLAFQNLFQQPIEASSSQGVVSAGLPEIDTTSSFQNDVPYQLDSVQNNVPTDQLPSNSTSLQSTNVNLGSCTGFNCQQPSLETRSKDYKTKVNS